MLRYVQATERHTATLKKKPKRFVPRSARALLCARASQWAAGRLGGWAAGRLGGWLGDWVVWTSVWARALRINGFVWDGCS